MWLRICITFEFAWCTSQANQIYLFIRQSNKGGFRRFTITYRVVFLLTMVLFFLNSFSIRKRCKTRWPAFAVFISYCHWNYGNILKNKQIHRRHKNRRGRDQNLLYAEDMTATPFLLWPRTSYKTKRPWPNSFKKLTVTYIHTIYWSSLPRAFQPQYTN